MYLNFMFLDRFLFELSRKNTHTQKHTHTHTDTHKDSDESSVVAFRKNATIMKTTSVKVKTIFLDMTVP